MVKRELTIHEFEAIKSSLAASISRKREAGGAAEHGADNTVKSAETWGPSTEGPSAEEELLQLLGEGTLFIEMDD